MFPFFFFYKHKEEILNLDKTNNTYLVRFLFLSLLLFIYCVPKAVFSLEMNKQSQC